MNSQTLHEAMRKLESIALRLDLPATNAERRVFPMYADQVRLIAALMRVSLHSDDEEEEVGHE